MDSDEEMDESSMADGCSDAVQRFNALSGQWETLPPMIGSQDVFPQFALMLASCGSMYVGSDRSIDRFDVPTGKWEILPPMPAAICHVDYAEVAYQGCLFVCAGIDGDG